MTTTTTIRTRRRTEIETIHLNPNSVAVGCPGKGVVIDEELLRKIKTIGKFNRN